MARLINTKTKQPLCQITNLTDLICTNVPLVAPKAGKYTFELQAFSQSDEAVSSSKLTDTKIQILPKPFKIVYFKLNNQEEPLARTFKEGESITLSWKVEGEDISVQVSPLGNVDLSGSQEIVAATTLPLIEITVTDQFEHTVKKGFPITIVRPQSPSPSPSPSPSTSLSPSPSPSPSSKATPKPPASPTPSNKGI